MSTIDDERVERMRSRVMSGVDSDVRRRAGRLRRARTGALGSLAALALVVVAGYGITATGSGTAVSNSADSSSGASRDEAAPESAPELDREAGREVVVTGSALVVTDDPRAASSELARWVEQRGGRIDARVLDDSGDRAHATLTIRVPSDQVSATVDRLDTYGDVDSVSLVNDDVTATVRDLDARISALRVSIDRLEKIVADSTTSDELVQAEQALTDRQSQLEQLETQQAGLGEQVDLATLTIELTPSESARDVDPGGFRGGLVSGWNGLVSTFDGTIGLVGLLLPWLGVLLVGYAGYRVVRKVRRS